MTSSIQTERQTTSAASSKALAAYTAAELATMPAGVTLDLLVARALGETVTRFGDLYVVKPYSHADAWAVHALETYAALPQHAHPVLWSIDSFVAMGRGYSVTVGTQHGRGPTVALAAMRALLFHAYLLEVAR